MPSNKFTRTINRSAETINLLQVHVRFDMVAKLEPALGCEQVKSVLRTKQELNELVDSLRSHLVHVQHERSRFRKLLGFLHNEKHQAKAQRGNTILRDIKPGEESKQPPAESR